MTQPKRELPSDANQPADDAIIARALRWSLGLGAVAVLLLGIVMVLWRAGQAPAPVETAVVAAPVVSTAPAVSKLPALPFTDVTAEAGIRFVHRNGAYGESLLPETMGGGVGFADVDNDDDPDLIFVNSQPWPWRPAQAQAPTDGASEAGVVLYLNDGTGRYTDVSASAGLQAPAYGMGLAVGDYNGDGLEDIYVTALGANRLYRNVGEARFVNETASAGVAGDADDWSTGAAFFDYDGDGDLDLFVTNYVRWSRELDLEVDYRLAGIGRAYGPPGNYAGSHSRLYRNEGAAADGKVRFVDVSVTAGIHVTNPGTGFPMGKGLAVMPVDTDLDGHLDVVVANDTVRNFLFRNLGNGKFAESGTLAGLAFDNSGSATGAMGIDGSYYNNDDDLAIVIANFANEMTSFYVAPQASGLFSDDAIVLGIGPDSRRVLSFGVFFADLDLDGRLDFVQANGHVEDEINLVQPSQTHEQATQVFWNCGDTCQRMFVPLPGDTLGDLAQPQVGRGAAYADIDGDGDLDLALTQAGRAARLLRNDQRLGGHWLRLSLRGTGMNRSAIGAQVQVLADGVRQRRTVMPARGYLSSMERVLSFGLGAAREAQRVTVTWPDGTVKEIENLAGNVEYRLTQGEALVRDAPPATGAAHEDRP